MDEYTEHMEQELQPGDHVLITSGAKQGTTGRIRRKNYADDTSYVVDYDHSTDGDFHGRHELLHIGW